MQAICSAGSGTDSEWMLSRPVVRAWRLMWKTGRPTRSIQTASPLAQGRSSLGKQRPQACVRGEARRGPTTPPPPWACRHALRASGPSGTTWPRGLESVSLEQRPNSRRPSPRAHAAPREPAALCAGSSCHRAWRAFRGRLACPSRRARCWRLRRCPTFATSRAASCCPQRRARASATNSSLGTCAASSPSRSHPPLQSPPPSPRSRV
mmetsp:Transcript_11550/g.21908  ORF Transcript_11550/g.21908 Transcript_11550/m.21908 type:complete len:208 (-) Transcript_11550:74-697(-)